MLKSQHNNSYAIWHYTLLRLCTLHYIAEIEITWCHEIAQNHRVHVAAQNEQSASWYLQFCNFLELNQYSKSCIFLNKDSSDKPCPLQLIVVANRVLSLSILNLLCVHILGTCMHFFSSLCVRIISIWTNSFMCSNHLYLSKLFHVLASSQSIMWTHLCVHIIFILVNSFLCSYHLYFSELFPVFILFLSEWIPSCVLIIFIWVNSFMCSHHPNLCELVFVFISSLS